MNEDIENLREIIDDLKWSAAFDYELALVILERIERAWTLADKDASEWNDEALKQARRANALAEALRKLAKEETCPQCAQRMRRTK